MKQATLKFASNCSIDYEFSSAEAATIPIWEDYCYLEVYIFFPHPRWRFVIHGGIDGCSRMLVFLGMSDNNRTSTVHALFINAIITYGIPPRICCDYGVENNDVFSLMDELRGPDHYAALRGRSTHYQRIE